MPLLDAFALLKTRLAQQPSGAERTGRRLEVARMVLAGPDPASVADDPEAVDVFAELTARYTGLPEAVRRDIAIVTLPMASRKQNALMVNALQRASDVIAQNSWREAFGLTVAEAMWKRASVLGSNTAAGVAFQIRDRVDGRLVEDPRDVDSLAHVLAEMLGDTRHLEESGRNGQQRVHDRFLVFSELQLWLVLLSELP
jgi:trehalose synthase